ncbi:uncharacterized protein LOC107271217 [Cephus cinctus]|uniref:Uncharacterized protein LOC107271217 n=1 Tax=Cephus cinctus TaxID=211228 RepID=A0AAJ7RNK7_CEPCN|nr:uncharacterized protein LOC107271217 [Cephus cinctus]
MKLVSSTILLNAFLLLTRQIFKNSCSFPRLEIKQLAETKSLAKTEKYLALSYRNYFAKFFCLPQRFNRINDARLSQHIQELRKTYFEDIDVLNDPNNAADDVLHRIVLILKRTSREQLLKEGPTLLVPCSIKVLFHYEYGLPYKEGLCDWKQRRHLKLAKESYYNLLRSFVPEKSKELVKVVIKTIHKGKLWLVEDFAYDLLWTLLELNVSGFTVVQRILNKLEMLDNDIPDARAIVRVLYELLNVYHWPEDMKTIAVVERLLKLFHKSMVAADGNDPPYGSLRKGLEVCVRHILQRLPNDHLLVAIRHMCLWTMKNETNDETILDFGSTLEYAAFLHNSSSYEKTLTSEVFPMLMHMIGSTNRLANLLGNRVLQYLLDRNNNKHQFDTPKIFFENTQFDLCIGKYNRKDKIFLKTYREELHDCLVKSVINHCSTRLNLEATYCTICLLAVEVPCGFTAASTVCLAMNLQELTLERKDLSREVSFHVHATVMAIMSLLCWVHHAKVFFNYINKIMMERAQWAPHLNPPLQSRYDFAIHHILWDKPEFFFVDWETRYGLWKCFRLKEERRSVISSH